MKPGYLSFPFVFYAAIFLSGCGFFRKTVRNSHKESQLSSKQTEASMLVLKNANKETQVVTYWTDSGFYQVAHIKEQVELSKSGQWKAVENQQAKRESKIREKEPIGLWMYVAGVVSIVLLYVVYRNLFPEGL